LGVAAYRAVRHAAPGGDFEPMTILVVWSQHPLAGISRSRRRARFIPAPVSAGTTQLITLRSGHRPRRQAPVRNYPRHSAFTNRRKTITRKRRSATKSA